MVLPAGAATTTVSVVDFAFSPKTIKSRRATPCVAQHRYPHAYGDAGRPALGLLDRQHRPGATSAGKVLSAAGIYPYHCTIHPSMVGSIKVPVKVRPTSGTTATVFVT